MAQQKRVFKTQKKLTRGGGDLLFRKYTDYEEGDEIIGEYVGVHHDSKYDNDHWIIKVLDCTIADRKFGKEVIGKELVMNSAGKLDKAMKELEEGEIVKITYEGKSEITKGKWAGSDAHQFTVEVVVEDDGTEEEDDDSDSL